ncbi:MAG: histidinol-phosphatase [Clostridia bacterium]|nr:histidinol-phosphatase [Clostridia bacterium]
MITQDLHIHTVFSDGKNTPEEMVLSAIKKGLKVIGFSDHSYTCFDEEYCIKKDSIDEYICEIENLKVKYRDKIKILCGIEQDYYSDIPTHNLDYVIGSVHYVKKDGEYIPVDNTAAHLSDAAKKHFGGDVYALVEEYYCLVGNVAERTNADVIGHFDLITKFSEKEALFDKNHPRYISAWKEAVDKLLPFNIPFEINTGAISRGYKTTAYPDEDIIRYIKENGGKFILSSDSHSADTVAFDFQNPSYEAFL